MFRQLFLFIVIILTMTAKLFAQHITRAEAIDAAANALRYEYRDNDFGIRAVDTVFSLNRNGHALLYEVHFSDQKIVILSGHRSCIPILGILQNQSSYFENGILQNKESLPDGLRFLLDNYVDQVANCSQNNSILQPNTEWNELLVYNEGRLNNNRSVSPLISAQWGQKKSNDGYYINAYNHFTPTCQKYGHCPAGCVAVAMGQIMKKWQYPQTIPNTCRHYYWDYMPDSLVYSSNYTTERDSIARFLLECGLSVNMSYCAGDCSKDVSNAVPSAVPNALRKFGYESTNVKYKSNYPLLTWDSLMHRDLDNGRPIYYSGYGSDGGHAFICDGYNHTGLYHFNWGWCGNYDGWFTTNDLTPGIYSFTNSQCAIFNIHPSTCWENIIFGCDKYFVYNNATYSSEETIQNDGHVFSVQHEAIVTLKAGEEIILTDGFSVSNGGIFVAKIEDCAPDDLGAGNNVAPIAETRANRTTAVDVAFTPSLQIFPNPANSTVTLQLADPQDEIRQITVSNMQGQVMLSQTVNATTPTPSTYPPCPPASTRCAC